MWLDLQMSEWFFSQSIAKLLNDSISNFIFKHENLSNLGIISN